MDFSKLPRNARVEVKLALEKAGLGQQWPDGISLLDFVGFYLAKHGVMDLGLTAQTVIDIVTEWNRQMIHPQFTWDEIFLREMRERYANSHVDSISDVGSYDIAMEGFPGAIELTQQELMTDLLSEYDADEQYRREEVEDLDNPSDAEFAAKVVATEEYRKHWEQMENEAKT